MVLLLSSFPQFAEIPCERNNSSLGQLGLRKMRFSQGKGWGRAEQALPATVPGAGNQKSTKAEGCFGREEAGVCHLHPRNSKRSNMNSYGGFGVPWKLFRHTSLVLMFA